YANVDINNTSNYKLIVNRVDTTKNRVGKITIIDTARIDTAATDAKTVYTLDAAGVKRETFSGTLSSGQPTSDGDSISQINYVSTGSAVVSSVGLTWAPRSGLHYVWTEGQSLTQTTITRYEKRVFNLFGGGTGLEDWLAGDNSYVWQHIIPTDPRPLL